MTQKKAVENTNKKRTTHLILISLHTFGKRKKNLLLFSRFN